MKTISVVINARLQSTRLPNKMLLPFSGSTLIEIALEKLDKLYYVQNRYLAVYEEELKRIGKKYKNIEILNRSYKEVKRGIVTLTTRFKYFEQISSDYIMLLNPCCPCLSLTTILDSIKYFAQHNIYNSYTSVIKTRDWIFNDKGVPVTNRDCDKIATNIGNYFYKATHMFHILNREYFLKNGEIWTMERNDPHGIIVPEEEAFDIDNKLEFDIAEYVYSRTLQ